MSAAAKKQQVPVSLPPESGTHRVAERDEDDITVSLKQLRCLIRGAYMGDATGSPKLFAHYAMAAVSNDLEILADAVDDANAQSVVRALIIAQGRLDAAIELDQLFFAGEEEL